MKHTEMAKKKSGHLNKSNCNTALVIKVYM